MPHFKCLAVQHAPPQRESEADPIGDLCTVRGSLLEPVADFGEIVGYRVAGAPVQRVAQRRGGGGPADRRARRRDHRSTRAGARTSPARNRKLRR